MNLQKVQTAAGILLAFSVAVMSASVEAGKGAGNRGSSQSGGFPSASGATYGSSQSSGYGYAYQHKAGGSKNQYQHRHQHQHRNQTGNGQAHQERQQYSDFQGWLNQSENPKQAQNQYRHQTQTMHQEGL